MTVSSPLALQNFDTLPITSFLFGQPFVQNTFNFQHVASGFCYFFMVLVYGHYWLEAEFAELYGFHHQTSSPHFPQSNGQTEWAVRTVKQLLEHSTDPYMALLSYQATPLSFCGLSPAELLMGHHIRTDIPQAANLFIREWSYLDQFSKQHKKYKA